MSVAAIVERVSAAIQAGTLVVAKGPATVVDVRTMRDLQRPWGEIFPEAGPEEEDFSVFRDGALRRPHMVPRPRRSRRPLPLPRLIAATRPGVRKGMYLGIQAFWQWYEANGKADDGLLTQPFDMKGLYAFLDPWSRCASYPLDLIVEDLYNDDRTFQEIDELSLRLPFYHYDFEESGVVQAFLEGAHGIAWLMSHYFGREGCPNLPSEDNDLIKQRGFEAISEVYRDFDGEKSCDLRALENFEAAFFSEVASQWPEQWQRGWDIIGGDYDDVELGIRSKGDIDFAVAYTDAFDRMMSNMPHPVEFEQNDGCVAEAFAHELCEVWRKVHGLPSIEWKNPKAY